MEDSNGIGNTEKDSVEKEEAARKKAGSSFIMFFIIFGWEGPFAVIIGLSNGDLGFILGGLIITSVHPEIPFFARKSGQKLGEVFHGEII